MGLIDNLKKKYNAFELSDLVWGFDLANNKLEGIRLIRPYGKNIDIDTGASEDIWNGNGVYTGFPETSGTISVVSSSALDTSNGTGAKTVLLTGLDTNWNPITETITLNGTTPVITTNQFLRCSRATVVSAGNTKTNQGEITATRAGDSNIKFFQMPVGTSVTYLSAYTVPAGFTAFFVGWYAYTNRGTGNQFDREADIVFTAINNVTNVKYRLRPVNITNASPLEQSFYEKPFVIPEKYDCIMTCTSVSQSDSDISAGYDLILIPNDMLQ